MRLLKNEKTENYHEIEVQYSFLWIKWNEKYRLVGGDVFRFKNPNTYYNTGLSERIRVYKLFYAVVD